MLLKNQGQGSKAAAKQSAFRASTERRGGRRLDDLFNRVYTPK